MPPDLRQAAGTFGKMHGVWGKLFFLKASNATRPIQRDDASIVPYKLFAAFIIIGKVSLRRDEGIPPYRYDLWYTL